MNTPTLDTAAIRARFDGAVIGIRADGTMAVLLPMEDGEHFDLISGRSFDGEFETVSTLIRPGDECEAPNGGHDWKRATYRGFSGSFCRPFKVVYNFAKNAELHFDEADIRPLPAPAVQTVEQKAVELVKELAARFYAAETTVENMAGVFDLVVKAAALFGEGKENDRG